MFCKTKQELIKGRIAQVKYRIEKKTGKRLKSNLKNEGLHQKSEERSNLKSFDSLNQINIPEYK